MDNDQPPLPESAVRGRVVRAHGLWFEVTPDSGETAVIATVRGALKRQRQRTDIVAVGDNVWITDLGEGEAVIERVEPRCRSLARLARNTRDVEQIIIANPDQVLFVFAAHDPEPHRRMLDRFLILAELQELPAIIGIAKIDLDTPDRQPRPRELFADYEQAYDVFYFSSKTGKGIEPLREVLNGKLTVLAGPSGVGKSSLLNVLDPENRREVSHVSSATGKGRHTTIGARLQRIDDTTYLGDTPGMRALAMRAVPGSDLDRCYREFRPYLGQCFFDDCTHIHEPRCAVRGALEAGAIPSARYESYVALRTGGELDDAGIV
jgi:ribosome biogenesis GTPase